MKLFSKKIKKFIAEFEKSSTFASLFTKQSAGVVVQLVRIPACHAGGRGFESLPHRRKDRFKSVFFYFSFHCHYLQAS